MTIKSALCRALLLAGFSGVAMSPARAQSATAQDACATFKWPVTVERDLFATRGKPVLTATSSIPALADGALDVTLSPPGALKFAITPRRAPKDDSGNAVISIGKIAAAGHYQVTLSEEAWVDFVQNGAVVNSSDFSGVKGCPGIRKSVRFDLQSGPAILQISASASPRILIAIRKID